jgi:hypothetical protein
MSALKKKKSMNSTHKNVSPIVCVYGWNEHILMSDVNHGIS